MKCGLQGVNLPVTQFVRQFTNVSSHPRAYNREQKKKFREKLFWKCDLRNPLGSLLLSLESAKDC